MEYITLVSNTIVTSTYLLNSGKISGQVVVRMTHEKRKIHTNWTWFYINMLLTTITSTCTYQLNKSRNAGSVVRVAVTKKIEKDT